MIVFSDVVQQVQHRPQLLQTAGTVFCPQAAGGPGKAHAYLLQLLVVQQGRKEGQTLLQRRRARSSVPLSGSVPCSSAADSPDSICSMVLQCSSTCARHHSPPKRMPVNKTAAVNTRHRMTVAPFSKK